MQALRNAEAFGSYQNRLGILAEDGFEKFYPAKLREISGHGATTLAQMLPGTKREYYSRLEPIRIPAKLKQAVFNVVGVADLAFELFSGNVEETQKWISSPNIYFFGQSPFDICLQGDAKSLLEWLRVRVKGGPGQFY